MRSCRWDNPARSPDATEFAEHIPATSSSRFAYTEGTGRFEQTEFQNFPHECGNVSTVKTGFINPQVGNGGFVEVKRERFYRLSHNCVITLLWQARGLRSGFCHFHPVPWSGAQLCQSGSWK